MAPQMKELIEFVAKKLVDHPEDVRVRVIENDEGQIIELRVHPEDMGKVIGKSGKTAKAIRTLLSSAAMKSNVRANLQIIE
ncbi:MAG: UPF0109 protein [Candidatus Hydrogenedentota bacterium]